MPKREYEIRASHPSKFPLRDLNHCIRIVRTGDAEDPDSAAVELPRSEILALASAGNLIVFAAELILSSPLPPEARASEKNWFA